MQSYQNFDSCVIFLVAKNNFQRIFSIAFTEHLGNQDTRGILKNIEVFLFHANMSNYFKKKRKKREAVSNSCIRNWILIFANISEIYLCKYIGYYLSPYLCLEMWVTECYTWCWREKRRWKMENYCQKSGQEHLFKISL